MENKNKYDAFISYRHAELDKFVAVNLHKKLEAFKLPKGVVSPTGKTRIERVFRDQDELPLSSNLSDPITEALETSDYLVVICTPRLPESEWCKREVETFIRLHGRERVLAVLAEGEPHESFPEALTKEAYEVTNPDGSVETKYHYFEPLAADVRGKNNKEILKAMNDAVLRIAASIFGLSYDDLKQRHKERAMKRTISIVSAVAAAMMLFSAVCMAMMFKIIKQSEMIMDQNNAIMSQNDEIKAQSAQIQNQNELIQDQYLQSQLNLAQATTINAQSLMGQGRFYDAMYSLRKVMPSSQNDDSFPYTEDAEFGLAEALEVYKSPYYYYGGRTFESESVIETVKISPNSKKVASIDVCANFHVWDIATGKEFFSKALFFDTVSIDLNESFVFLDDKTILYNDNNKLIRLDLEDNTSKIISNPDLPNDSTGKIYHAEGTETYTIFSDNGITVYDYVDDSVKLSTNFMDFYNKTDSILNVHFFNVSKVVESNDGKYFSFLLSAIGVGDDSKDYLYIFNTESNEINKYSLSDDYYFHGPVISDQKLYFMYSPNYINNSFDYTHRLVCMDCESGKTLWDVETPFFNEIVKRDSIDIIYAYECGLVYAYDSKSGEQIAGDSVISTLCDIIINGNGTAKCLSVDGYNYAFNPSTNNTLALDIFNSKPAIRIENYYFKNSFMFVQFKDKTYFTLYEDKDYKIEPFLECEYSTVMSVNDEDCYIRYNSADEKIEYYTYGAKAPVMSADKGNTYYSFVGNGTSYLASYGTFGLKIYNLSDGSTVKEYGNLECPIFPEEGVTNDRNYLYSLLSSEGQIYLYDLSTGENIDIYKPNIPKEEKTRTIGLSKEYYAVVRESGVIEVYKGASKEPCFSSIRSISGKESLRVCHNADVFAVTYLDGTVEFYRFGDTIELIQSINNPHSSATCEIEQFEYYADQNMYIISINLRTLVLNENFKLKSYIEMNSFYFPHHDCFVYYDSLENALFTHKRYSYEDLIAESDKRLGDYLPPKHIMEQYGIIE